MKSEKMSVGTINKNDPGGRSNRRGCSASKGKFGITGTLFISLAAFTAFALLVVWIFQVLLLPRFYERSKMSEMYRMADVIERHIKLNTEKSVMENTVYRMASDYSVCMLTYSIKGLRGQRLLSCDVSKRCLIHHVPTRTIDSFYREALENGGSLVKNVDFTGQDEVRGEDDFAGETVYIRIFETDDGSEYMILLNAQMQPVSAVTNTYKNQFKTIVVIMLIGSLLISVIISRKITKPIVKLNKSVEKLARGDYNEVFDGNGYREIQELSDALNYASSELSKTDALQKELLANISHDLRTPLTMIKGYSEVMRDIPGENTPENVQIIVDETTHLTELVNDLLDISRIKAGTRKPEPEQFSLTETVKATLHRYEKLTEKDGYVINFICDGDAYVVADRTMMLQVIYNLINNAINYTGSDKTVTVRQIISGSRVRIAVTDTGEGIAPEQIPYIWDRYYKVDKIHRRAMVGTGLGLSIVKGVLELHKSTYGLESALGQGSTFWFELDTVPFKDETTKTK